MSLELSVKATAVKPSSTLNIAATVTAMRAAGKNVVSFTVGQPDFITPRNIREAAKRAIDTGFTKYTAVAGYPELLQAVSDKFKQENGLDYTPEQIVVSNGGKHSLMNVFSVLLNPGDEVLIPGPYWLSYPEIVKLADGVPVYVMTDASTDYKVCVKALEQVITPKTKALIINTPNNPTGMMYSRKELKAIADFAVQHDIYVVSDEIYEYLNYTGEPHVSIASLGPAIYERTVTVNGLSKSYAMTGWRMGYIGAPLSVARAVAGIQSHQTSNISSITQKAAYEALTGPHDERDAMVRAFTDRRELLLKLLRPLPHIHFQEPQGAFYVLVDCTALIDTVYDGVCLKDAAMIADILLRDYAVAVIPCADFGYPNHIRLSYAVHEDEIRDGVRQIAVFLSKIETK
ncbi:MAG: pyridoxal phosphate-dependent aminotransferase [Eubacteriales bacterium]|nr:pyridoxal phosphate-dependent aminotransferase [Eubacteriales bacterium]